MPETPDAASANQTNARWNLVAVAAVLLCVLLVIAAIAAAFWFADAVSPDDAEDGIGRLPHP